jgi:hypothetical protein
MLDERVLTLDRVGVTEPSPFLGAGSEGRAFRVCKAGKEPFALKLAFSKRDSMTLQAEILTKCPSTICVGPASQVYDLEFQANLNPFVVYCRCKN